MDRLIWRRLCVAVAAADRTLPRVGRRRPFADTLVVKMHLWAVWHDRPRVWATQREHYTTLFRPRQLPSASQFYRRLKTPRVVALIEAVNDHAVGAEPATGDVAFDGKPLLISRYSADPDAEEGYGLGRIQRGYKLHALASADRRILRAVVHPLNVGEPNTARTQLVHAVPPHTLVLADANYDSAPLYAAVAARGAHMLARPKGKPASDDRLRRMHPARRDAVLFWRQRPHHAEQWLKRRDLVERVFSALCGFGGGLTGLPPWVRRLDRVRLWVTAKLAIYHARLHAQQQLTA